MAAQRQMHNKPKQGRQSGNQPTRYQEGQGQESSKGHLQLILPCFEHMLYNIQLRLTDGIATQVEFLETAAAGNCCCQRISTLITCKGTTGQHGLSWVKLGRHAIPNKQIASCDSKLYTHTCYSMWLPAKAVSPEVVAAQPVSTGMVHEAISACHAATSVPMQLFISRSSATLHLSLCKASASSTAPTLLMALSERSRLSRVLLCARPSAISSIPAGQLIVTKVQQPRGTTELEEGSSSPLPH